MMTHQPRTPIFRQTALSRPSLRHKFGVNIHKRQFVLCLNHSPNALMLNTCNIKQNCWFECDHSGARVLGISLTEHKVTGYLIPTTRLYGSRAQLQGELALAWATVAQSHAEPQGFPYGGVASLICNQKIRHRYTASRQILCGSGALVGRICVIVATTSVSITLYDFCRSQGLSNSASQC